MPDLRLTLEGAEAAQHAAAPLLLFKLAIRNEPLAETVHAIVLRVQIMIEATRRNYTPGEQQNLKDLFGEPERWGSTLRRMLWTHASVVVPRFTAETQVDVPVHCTFDFNIAATKYFHGLSSGDLPLCFQFSGTVFHESAEGGLQAAPISWDKEARYRLPLSLWKELMNAHYPNTAWLPLQRDTFDRLYRWKVREGIPTWEAALERALSSVAETVPS